MLLHGVLNWMSYPMFTMHGHAVSCCLQQGMGPVHTIPACMAGTTRTQQVMDFSELHGTSVPPGGLILVMLAGRDRNAHITEIGAVCGDHEFQTLVNIFPRKVRLSCLHDTLCTRTCIPQVLKLQDGLTHAGVHLVDVCVPTLV